LSLGSREIIFRLVDGGGFRGMLEFKDELSGLDLIAASDGEMNQGSAQRAGEINKFAFDITLINPAAVGSASGNEYQ